MQKESLEPGLLRVFRGYAGVRFALYLLAGLRFLFSPDISERIDFDPLPYLGLTLLGMAILLVYLLLPWLQEKLGRAYLPLGIILAASSLILERVFTPGAPIWFWGPDPFFYVLLILVAWQYDFKAVLLFTLGTSVFELVLNLLFPEQALYIGPLEGISSQMIAMGSIALRTVSFLIIGFVITRLVSAQRRQQKALAEANIKLVQYASTVEQLTISRERNRLSRELHDTVAHTLSALAVQIDALMAVWEPIPDKAEEMLENMLETTRRGLEETRRSLKDLRAAPLEDMGLALAIAAQAKDFSARNELSLILDVPEEINSLPQEIEHGFYRVAQEALENVIQHAGAKQVQVKLAQDGESLVLIVADDGRGFDTGGETAGHQLGVQGMYERAELIGAELDVSSEVDKGTIVRLSKENGSGKSINL
ncbi:MAG: sensor histidine kinase [Anaerolineales bacterium]|nr:sensor histidine kinase [Anaerolineales bacterium]